MALEQRLTLAPVVLLHHHQSSSSAGAAAAATAEEEKAPRLPRWTRQELLVLIQGKRVAENRVRRGRMGEPKWSSVSSYCKRHGVNRGPVQCRKRWSNLAGDFKKIKEWETQIKKEESFWIMRNDLRRERKLPGFFDREVYDILDGGGGGDDDNNKKSSSSSLVLLSLAPEATEKEDKEVGFDSPEKEAAAPTPPVSAAAATGGGGGYESFSQGVPPPPAGDRGDKETSPSRSPSPGPEVRKRKRDDDAGAAAAEGEMSVQKQLIEAMERNGRLLTSQLEIQNTNSQLDREQRKNDANSLFSVLNKLADAMVRIADKL
ncbi:hypothetical protein SSX86_027515 [Deinandra increscens subsp. villosa]|uniref:Myb-like domain-containing protein n=1 Tax=Deinandra increscens subsp. villosa TaxID=3103831 RepID=A0AAP0C6Z0_9ASTR